MYIFSYMFHNTARRSDYSFYTSYLIFDSIEEVKEHCIKVIGHTFAGSEKLRSEFVTKYKDAVWDTNDTAELRLVFTEFGYVFDVDIIALEMNKESD